MAEDEKFVALGTPLIEQDAEYLASLLERNNIPHRLVQDLEHPLSAVGRTWVLQVLPRHRSWAQEIRANEFPEPAQLEPEPMESIETKARKRPIMRTLFLGFAGAMVGLRVGVKLRGGGVGALLVGGVMGVVAMMASMLFGAQQKTVNEDAKVAETDGEKPEKHGE